MVQLANGHSNGVCCCNGAGVVLLILPSIDEKLMEYFFFSRSIRIILTASLNIIIKFKIKLVYNCLITEQKGNEKYTRTQRANRRHIWVFGIFFYSFVIQISAKYTTWEYIYPHMKSVWSLLHKCTQTHAHTHTHHFNVLMSKWVIWIQSCHNVKYKQIASECEWVRRSEREAKRGT